MTATMMCDLKRSYSEGYYQDGDLVLGGVLSLTHRMAPRRNYAARPKEISPYNFDLIPMSRSYQHVLAFVFAVEKINKDLHFLPNTSLGFRLYDNCYDGGQAYENVISLLSERDKLTPIPPPVYGYEFYYAYGQPSYNLMDIEDTEKVRIFPNYNCQDQMKMVAVISGLTSESSRQVANLLGIYKVPQFHAYLKKTFFNNSAVEEASCDGNGDMATYEILNWIQLPNHSLVSVRVGEVNLQHAANLSVTIQEEMTLWNVKFAQPPHSICSHNCPHGLQKVPLKDKPSCCFHCTECPKGEISNQTDMDHCVRCEKNLYPNEARNTCIPKNIIYLSYEEPLGIASASTSLSFSVFAALLLGIFIRHRKSPIVKANNRHLSYILLFTLLLCFLSSLIFIGQPRKLTCLFRHTAFWVIFSTSLGTVLAKTITVILAFKATKPGSGVQKWLRPRAANSLVIICTLIPSVICMIWLGTSPPFPEADFYSEPGYIILECNKGSPTAFYSILGYMGVLALGSFIVAFLARKLPDSFNETKFITFSMLVFCSIWMCFLPTYLSTKGKYMVVVEIFSILVSSAGLLGCIFLPKCYIILLHLDKNQKVQITSKYFHRQQKEVDWKHSNFSVMFKAENGLIIRAI